MNLTQEEYAALVSLARKGTANTDQRVGLDQYLRGIEEREGVKRYLLWVQWQEVGAALPPGTRFPEKWPPELRYLIERFDRPISRTDVTRALELRAKNPLEILVTADPAAVVGWMRLDTYPWK
jgi:hypothetical protein